VRGAAAAAQSALGKRRTVGNPDETAELEEEGDPERDVEPEVWSEPRSLWPGLVLEPQRDGRCGCVRQLGVVMLAEREAAWGEADETSVRGRPALAVGSAWCAPFLALREL